MKDSCFLDTNIIVYSFDESDIHKKQIAFDLIIRGLKKHNTFISYQVVQEFINVSTRKFSAPLTLSDCKLYLNKVLMPMWKIYSSKELILASLDISNRFNYSFYDSLIIASAHQASANILYSEDFQHEQSIGTMTIINPFI